MPVATLMYVRSSPERPAPHQLFGERAHVGVVVDEDGHVVGAGQMRLHVVAAPRRQDERRQAARRRRVHRARHGHADAEQAPPRDALGAQAVVDELAHQRQRAGGIALHRVRAVTGDAHLAAQVGQRHEHVRGAELDADDEEGVVVKAEQRRAPPAARQPLAGRLHQARALEVADDGRHRRRAEPSAPRQLGARHLALLPDEVEQECRVARSHSLRVDGELLELLRHGLL